MIIDKPEYRKNSKGDISRRQIVTVKCDICGKEWDTAYEHRQRKTLKDDRCSTCRRPPKGNACYFKRHKPVDIICSHCGKVFFKAKSQVRSSIYCSRACYIQADLKRFEHLPKTFQEHPNELAYLCGLILGDGYLRSRGKHTTQIIVAFDEKYPELIKLACDILEKLQIIHSLQPQVKAHCQVINFSLPSALLQRYGMLWNGDKYREQPKPIDDIVNNINLAAGLINSDGHVVLIRNKYENIGFTNTVKSIVQSLKQCLNYNDIQFSSYHYNLSPDKRTGKIYHSSYQIRIGRKEEIAKLRRITKYLK